MTNLANFFSGGGGGAVPLRGLVPFPHDTLPKITQGGQVFLRSGKSEVVDYDPSLQSWVDNNIMFVNTQSVASSVSANYQRLGALDTDGAGKWMVSGFIFNPAHTLPLLYYSSDDGVSWSPLAIPAINTSAGVTSIKSGGNGVWIITVTGNGVKMFRTTNNGANWTDITATAMSSSASAFKVIETTRAGVWLIGFGSNQTTLRRSTDNGASWADVNYPLGNCFALKAGNGQWIAGGNDTSVANNHHQTIVVSLDNGLTWQSPITTVNLADFAYVQGGWVGVYQSAIYHNVAGDFTKWNIVDIQYDDVFLDAQQTSYVWFLTVGLDGALWLKTSTLTFRSGDRGISWQRILPQLSPVMSGSNKRAVAVMLSNQASDIFGGILTGRPAAGCVYMNDGRLVNGGDNAQRYVMYIRIR